MAPTASPAPVVAPATESLPPGHPPPLHPDPAQLLATHPPLRHARLSHIRRKQLLRAAARPLLDGGPPPPGLNECCGSSCDPCVKTLWREEVGLWKARWGDEALAWAERRRRGDDDEEEEEMAASRPNSAKVEIELTEGAASGSGNQTEGQGGEGEKEDGRRIAMPGAWIEW